MRETTEKNSLAVSILIAGADRVLDDLKAGLKRLGYAPATIVASLAEAFGQLELVSCALVLVDIRLVDSDVGCDHLATLRSRWQLPVVLVAGNDDMERVQRIGLEPPCGCLVIPASDLQVGAVVETALYCGRMEQERHRMEERLHSESRLGKGNRRPIRWHDSLLRDKSGSIVGTLSSGQDATERWRAEIALERSREELRLTLDGFNNQLDGILGFAGLLLKGLQDPEQLELVESIISNASRSAELVDKLLAFSRRHKNVAAQVDIHELLDEVISLLARTIDKRITIQRQLDAEVAITTGDPTQLESMLLNLALNARDAMPDGGELTLASRVVELDQNHFLQITVSDTGIGMDSHACTQAFEPFFTTKNGEGSGLGLASVCGTVKSHGGSIEVSSEPGRGSVFTVYLPLTEPTPRPDQVTKQPRQRLTAGRILFAEDDVNMRGMVCKLLSSLGHEVTACSDGEQAFTEFRKSPERWDLVILDMDMPKRNGIDTFRAMVAVDPGVKAVLSSGYYASQTADEFFGLGGKALLEKPYRLAKLKEKLDEILGG